MPARIEKRVLKEIYNRVKEIIGEEGFGVVLRLAEILVMMTASRCYHRGFKSLARFTFDGREYRYLYHWYNATYWNERPVEVPIVSQGR